MWLWDFVLVGWCEVVEEEEDGDSAAGLGTARDPEPGAGGVGAAPRPFVCGRGGLEKSRGGAGCDVWPLSAEPTGVASVLTFWCGLLVSMADRPKSASVDGERVPPGGAYSLGQVIRARQEAFSFVTQSSTQHTRTQTQYTAHGSHAHTHTRCWHRLTTRSRAQGQDTTTRRRTVSTGLASFLEERQLMRKRGGGGAAGAKKSRSRRRGGLFFSMANFKAPWVFGESQKMPLVNNKRFVLCR